jgi:hypothetical protein
MTTFRQVVPNSTINPSNVSYEHFLVWLSPNGGVRQWLFSHTEGSEEESFESYTIESLDNIRSVPSEDRVRYEVRTKSLDADTFAYVKSIMKSNRVFKVSKTGVFTPIAIRGGSIAKDNQIKEFELRIRFETKEEFILNV